MRQVFTLLAIVLLLAAGLIAVARATSPTVDGIPCEFSEQIAYHVHAHLTIIPAGGRPVYPPANVGISTLHLCLFWLHTHDASGIIHIEAPHPFTPRLGEFFAIWGQPISRMRVWHYQVAPGALRIYVNYRRYAGNPALIPLHFHTAVTLELGPPYRRPPPVEWHGL